MSVNWHQAPLIEFAELVSTGPFGSMLHKSDYVSNGVPLINPINIVDEDIVPDADKQVGEEALARLGSYVLMEDDVVVGRRGEIGRCAVVGPAESGWVCGTGCFFVRPRPDLDARFLAHLLRSPIYRDQLEKASTGATMKNMSNTALAQLLVSVPSLDEQQRIVAILDEAFEGIATAKANAEKNLQNARELCEELIQGLFPEDGSIRVDAPSLDSLCELIVDCEHKTAPTQEHGIPSIRTPNIGRGRLLLEGVYRVSDEIYKEWSRRAEPQGGDLILAREAPAGNVAVIPGGMKVCLGQRTVLIRPKNDILEPDYLAQLLLRRNSQRRLLAHSRGATVQHINLKDIRAFKISAIPPLTEQRHLVEQVNELLEVEDRLVEIYERKLTALDKLKKSLLHQAFSGQL